MEEIDWKSLVRVRLDDEATDSQYVYGFVTGKVGDAPSPSEMPEMKRLYELLNSYGKHIGHGSLGGHYKPSPRQIVAEPGMRITPVLTWFEEDDYEHVVEIFPTAAEARAYIEARNAEEYFYTRDYTVYPCTVEAYAEMIEANPPLSEWGPGKLTF